MPALQIRLDGDGCWPDLATKGYVEADANSLQVALLHHGMLEGRPSVTFRMELPDGQTVLVQTSLRLLLTAARTLAVAGGESL